MLVETENGPVLIDTGLGMHDHYSPSKLVRFYIKDFGIQFAPEETALQRLKKLNIPREKIEHIVLSHLHFDHAGGLPDFPHATIHVHKNEFNAVNHPKGFIQVFGYDKYDFAHHPKWKLYEQCDHSWYGLPAILLPFSPQMFLVPLFGHTPGHCGIAIQKDSEWLLYAADALPTNCDPHLVPEWIMKRALGDHFNDLFKLMKENKEIQLLSGHMFHNYYNELD